MIKAVIFGFNGVIYNSTKYMQIARDSYLERFGVKRTKEEISKHLGSALQDQIVLYNKKYNLNLDYDTFSIETRRLSKELMIKDKIKPNSGVVELINNIKKKKIRVAIASFFPKQFLKGDLDMLGFSWNDFNTITTLDDIKKYRPDPEFLLLTSSKLNVRSEECIYISDDNEGLSVAKSIKMKTIGLVNNLQPEKYFKDADIIVTSLKELDVDKILKL